MRPDKRANPKTSEIGARPESKTPGRDELTQSTVSRRLFGTVRNGKKVRGAIPKLQKALVECQSRIITQALGNLEQRCAKPENSFGNGT